MSQALDATQKDALGEAAHIGAGSAAAALERFLGAVCSLSPPRVGGGTAPLGPVEAVLPLVGTCEGEVMVVFNARAAVSVIREMGGGREANLADLGGADLDNLCEAANILGCAYLTGLGDQTGLPFRPDPPVIRLGGRPAPAPSVIWVGSRLRGEAGFEIDFVLRLERQSVRRVLEALRIPA